MSYVTIENQNADGLGNQMFRIATGVAYANRTKKLFRDCNWKYKDIFKNYKYKTILPEQTSFIYFESEFKYQPIPISSEKESISICGYFQSEKYFDDYRKEILKLFQFRPEKRDDIFIHVRRGDYKLISDYLPLLEIDYYSRAINIMREKGYSKFIVLSDEIDLARDLFRDIKDVEVSFSENTDTIEDLKLMESCKGGIIANSSFSWWGAYLQNSDNIIAPGKWFGERAYKQNVFENDIVPERWLKI